MILYPSNGIFLHRTEPYNVDVWEGVEQEKGGSYDCAVVGAPSQIHQIGKYPQIRLTIGQI